MHTPTDDETPLLIDILKALARHRFELLQRIYGPVEECERLQEEINDELNPHVSTDSDTTTESRDFHAVESLGEISHETLSKMRRLAELEEYEISEADDEAIHAHPLCWLCERLEPLLGGQLDRFELEWAAHRLSTAIGWNSWNRQTPVDGEVQMEWPDIRWLGENLLALDRDGVTARLWRELQGRFRDILIEAGLLVRTQRSVDAVEMCHFDTDSPTFPASPISPRTDDGDRQPFLVSRKDLHTLSGDRAETRVPKNTISDFLKRRGLKPVAKGNRKTLLYNYCDVVPHWNKCTSFRTPLPVSEEEARQKLAKESRSDAE